MQIFFVGPRWLTGHEVLRYSPALKGKTGEVVAEPDSVRRLSPGAAVPGPDESSGNGPTVTSSATTVANGTGPPVTYVTGSDGKARRQTAEDLRRSRRAEQNSFNRLATLLETRANLAKSTLTRALNEAAADGWEVVQMASSGNDGGLVYLLKRR